MSQRSVSGGEIPSFEARLRESGLYPLTATGVDILQLNITRRCNLSCRHCHVEAGPDRREMMNRGVLHRCLRAAASDSVTTVDITGGAPELHSDLPWFVEQCARLSKRLIVRSNLVILLDKRYQKLVDLFAQCGVEIAGSLPGWTKERSDSQRGTGFFDKLIAAIRMLNERGYGIEGTGLILDLVHTPAGAFLPGPQETLELELRRRLTTDHGVFFSRLYTLTNCPLGRYRDYLVRTDNLADYYRELVAAYNPVAAGNVMCRTTVSVGWDGTLYDCDFNQARGLPVNHGAPAHIDLFEPESLSRRTIVVDDHCFGCTAGTGSSCQGSIG